MKFNVDLTIESTYDLETIEEYLNFILNLTDKRVKSFEIINIKEDR